jgi:glycosyltransferase XagB
MKSLDIIIPVLNEAENIKELVNRIDKAFNKETLNYNIIFVDDHSVDNTAKKIKKLAKNYPIKLILKKGKKGKAFSIIEGVQESTSKYIAMIDADLQYSPEYLPKMFKMAKRHGVVVANRTIHKTNFIRKWGSKLDHLIFGKILLGSGCDTQSGLKVFRKEIIEYVKPEDVTGWTLDMHIIHIAKDLGMSIGTIDIEFKDRKNGKSKINLLIAPIEIALAAIKFRLKNIKSSVYTVKPRSKRSEIGAGIIYKKKKFSTHTSLPLSDSAFFTFKLWQKVVVISLIALAVSGLLINTKLTLIIVIAALTFIYFLDLAFSGFVLTKSLHKPPEIEIEEKEYEPLKKNSLPVYTILCPLYKEANVLPYFVDSIKKLKWPKSKLEVMLLLEEDDTETLNAAKKLRLPKYIQTVVVPDSQPKTKPKACNYGLGLAKGEYVVIYDAEDKPDPLQLIKSYLAFKKLPNKVVCLQSKLNYYNTEDNILTRLFTAEYSLWFDLILPGLQSIGTIIPLGGTSNHFKTKILKKIHGWDPFNVTEDCDLGVRLFKMGYKTALINSVTLEEANSKSKSWIKQRSRWIKGYLQTYLIHMRNPITLFKQMGFHFFLFQLIIGMRMTFMIINPALWLMTISYFAAYRYVGPAIEELFPAAVFYVAVFVLVFGNFTYFYSYMIGSAKRQRWSVIKYIFLIPAYWIMTSIASVVAFYQLIVKPHYWEKTSHGLHLGREKQPKRFVLPRIEIGLPMPTLRDIGLNTRIGIVIMTCVSLSLVTGYSLLYGAGIVLQILENNMFILFSMLLLAVYSLYHHTRRNYRLSITGFTLSLPSALALSYGNALPLGDHIVPGLIAMFSMMVISILHFTNNAVINSNVTDFTDLFGKDTKDKNDNSKLRVLIFNWRDTKHMWAGGAEVYVHQIAKRWVEDGHDVTLFCGNDGNCKRTETVDGVEIIRRGGFFSVYFWAFVYYLSKFRGMYDVVIESENGAPFFTPLYVKVPKFLVVHHVHQEVFRENLSYPMSLIARFVESKMARLVYKNQPIITVSESSKKELIKLGFVNNGDIKIVTPGVDVNSFSKYKKTSHPSFIYFGRLKPYKNIDVAIEAFSMIANKFPDASLTIAGDGESKEDLKEMVNKLNLNDKIKFLGRVSEEEKNVYLAKNWLAIQPSSFEGWGITVIEANACGTPVVASRVNGLKDSVVHGKTGLLVKRRSAKAFYMAMSKVIKNEALRKKITIGAHIWSRNFDWDETSYKMFKIIESKLSEETTYVDKIPAVAEL